MNRISRPILVGAAIGLGGLVALILALSLTGSKSPGGDTPASTAAAGSLSAPQLWHNLAACLRSHGYAIADPAVQSNGTADWGGASGNVAFKRAMSGAGFSSCQEQIRALPAQDINPPPSAARLHELLLFARCMRAQGLSDWPDPHPDGTFPLNARLMGLGKGGTQRQITACGQYLNGGSPAISPSSVPAGQRSTQPSGSGG